MYVFIFTYRTGKYILKKVVFFAIFCYNIRMGKIVLKTVVLTLISFIAVVCIAYGFFASITPKFLAKTWAGIGNYDISMKYYEKQYDRTQDVSDLAIICNNVNEKEDRARAVKYLSLLTGNDGFSDFCDREDNLVGYKFTAYEFYYGKYACASFFNGGINNAVSVAKKSVQKGYTENNAFYSLLGVETLTAEDGAVIKTAIESLDLSESELVFANRDIEIANSIK